MIRTSTFALIACALALIIPSGASAAAGDPDPTFGTAGRALLPILIPVVNMTGDAIVIQPDGKILVAGTLDGNTVPPLPFVARYNVDGSQDLTFGDNGSVTVDGIGSQATADLNAIALAPGGKIVIAGSQFDSGGKNHMWVARLNPSGAIDSTFNGQSGYAINTSFPAGSNSRAEAVVVKPDGRIVLVGDMTDAGPDFIAFAQYRANGTLDTTGFGSGGLGITSYGGTGAQASSAALQPDGKVVIGGDVYDDQGSFAIARITDNGAFDPGFGIAGLVKVDFGSPIKAVAVAKSVAIQPNGMIVAGGRLDTASSRQIVMARVDSVGSPDPAFGTNGKVLMHFQAQADLRGIAIQPDGKIVGAGSASTSASSDVSDFLVARFNPNGSPDASYGVGGASIAGDPTVTDFANGVALQADGKAVAVGTTRLPGANQTKLVRNLTDPILSVPLSSRIGSPKKSKLKAKSFKKISGIAAGTGLVKVQVAILKTDKKLLKKKKRCLQVSSNKAKLKKVKAVKKKCVPKTWLTTKGTTSWSYTLKKALKPGKYSIYVRSVGVGGATQTAFSKKLGNLKTVTLTK